MFRQKITVYVRLVLALGLMTWPAAGVSQSSRSAKRAPAPISQSGVHSTHPRNALPQLVDITASTHIRFNHLASPDKKYIVESMSGGVALIDYDRDGWPDIYFTNAPDFDMHLAGKKARSALFHNNRDGTFTDVTDKAELAILAGPMASL